MDISNCIAEELRSIERVGWMEVAEYTLNGDAWEHNERVYGSLTRIIRKRGLVYLKV